jgi:hypothetical protein
MAVDWLATLRPAAGIAPMDPAHFAELARWTTEAGLAGKSETTILDGFCQRAVAAGLRLPGQKWRAPTDLAGAP